MAAEVPDGSPDVQHRRGRITSLAQAILDLVGVQLLPAGCNLDGLPLSVP